MEPIIDQAAVVEALRAAKLSPAQVARVRTVLEIALESSDLDAVLGIAGWRRLNAQGIAEMHRTAKPPQPPTVAEIAEARRKTGI